jgi:putative ABC transport system permease protein
MLRNYLQVAIRSFFRNPISSVVNISGLVIGMTAFILIIQYVRFELSYDNFHEKGNRIYRIQQDRYNKGVITTQWAAGCSAVGQALFENFPEVESFTRFQKWYAVLSYGERNFREENIYIADTSFFKIFSFKLKEGDQNTILRNTMEMVLSETSASKYFGDENPLGKSLRWNGGPELMITGIFRDVPVNSHLKPDILISWETLVQFQGQEVNTAWQWDAFFNYILLNPSTDYKEFEAKIPAFIEQELGEDLERWDAGVIYHLQPLKSIHLHSDYMFEAEINGNARTVFALLIVAIFLVVIAWINYINISTSRSLERARETGMRKVTGASRTQLISQFLLESVMVNILAILLAFVLVQLFRNTFNSFFSEKLDFSLRLYTGFWGIMLGIFIAGALISGIYPAFVLSSFKPATVFKGSQELKVGGMRMRRVLVIIQFSLSLLMISGTLVVFKQISYMQHYDLGININNTVVLRGPSVNDSTYNETFNAFKSELLRNSEIEMISTSTAVPGRQPTWNAGGIRLLSQGEDETNQYRIIGIDYNFVDLYGLSILEGRNFSEEFGRNSETVLFNENAIRLIGFEDFEQAMNQQIFFWGDTFNIVGIVKNYHQEGLKVNQEPLIFRFFENLTGYYSIRINPGNIQKTLNIIESQWRNFFPENPYEYFFLEDYFNEQYKNELQFGKVLNLFSLLAIAIACLGLFGLSSYTTAQRTREIGIRKVLGSSAKNCILLLMRFFMIQILISIPFGLGAGYIIMSGWLENFAYRIDIGWWFFLIPVSLLTVIAMLTVSSQIIKTANTNPATSLRYE